MAGPGIAVVMVGIFVALAALAFRFGAAATRRAAENGRRLAEALGLTFHPDKPTFGSFFPRPRVSGRMRGRQVELLHYSTGTGKSRRHWVAILARPNAAGTLEFSLLREGLGSWIRTLVGVKEIEVGEPAFDKTWFVRTNQEDFLRAALLPEIRAKLTSSAGLALRGSFEANRTGVRYAEEGGLHRAGCSERLVFAADIVCDLADIAEVWAERTG